MDESGEGLKNTSEDQRHHDNHTKKYISESTSTQRIENHTNEDKATKSKLASVRESLRKLGSLASEKLIVRGSEPIPIEDINEDVVVNAMLRVRPKEIKGRADLNFGIGEIEDELGWSHDVPIEARSLLQETIRRNLSNLSTKGEVKIIPVHDKDGRFVRRDYQITDGERTKLESRNKDQTQTTE